MKRLILLFGSLLIAITASAGEFRPAGKVQYGIGRYRVSVALVNGIDDLETLQRQLIATYGGSIESAAGADFDGFIARMTERAARMMSEHPRVLVIEEIAETTATPVSHNGNETWSTGTYSYDGAGNIKSIGTEKFTYDAFGRLTKGGSGGGHHQSYTYDRYGNVLTVTTDGDSATQLKLGVDPATNRISNSATPYNVHGQYDAAGRMTSYQGTHTFSYDATGLIRESTVNGVRKLFLYTPSGERLAAITVDGAGTEIYSTWTLRETSGKVLRRLTRTGGNWTWDQDYVYRDGQLLAAELPGARRHFHLDHLGSPRLITDGNGTKVALHDYYPFGLEETSPLQDGEVMKFTGHERDAAFLDYMHARSYLTVAGRFLSVDPGRDWDVHQPQSWNMYVYVRNNPTNGTDPTGRCVHSVVCLAYGRGAFQVDEEITVTATAPPSPVTFQERFILNDEIRLGAMMLNSWENTPAGRAEHSGRPNIEANGGEFMVAAPLALGLRGFAAGAGTNTSRVFWSGSQAAGDAATTFAQANGATTLEMTATGQALTSATEAAGFDAVLGSWTAASRAFAQGASGEVTVFQASTGVRVGSMFATQEYPALVANQAVTGIRFVMVYPNGTVVPIP